MRQIELKFALLLLLIVVGSTSYVKLSKLPAYNVDITQSSTSGISSGGFMAVQIGFAFSSQMVGVGVVAGGPYICAKGSMATATTECMSMPQGIDLAILNQKAQSLQQSSEIDNLSNVKKQNIYIYSGAKDTVVKKGVVEKLVTQYGDFNVANVVTEYSIPSEHAWITNNFGNSCGALSSPYMSNCNYNQAEKILTQIYGTIKPGTQMVDANLMQFDQTPYKAPSMLGTGYIYVPSACKLSQPCKVHIALHGCNMSTDKIQDDFVRHSGLNEIGEANNYIILYPQATASEFEPSNPQGCWDWWGYDDGVMPTYKYVTKVGKQMSMIYNMLKDLAGTSVQ